MMQFIMKLVLKLKVCHTKLKFSLAKLANQIIYLIREVFALPVFLFVSCLRLPLALAISKQPTKQFAYLKKCLMGLNRKGISVRS